MERGWIEMSPNCPRCGSTNTKFCYYNNYSLTQPRYFCKGCRRYWTKGGSLRNVPVGGGCRKSRRGNKLSLRVASGATTTPYPNASTPPCRRTISAFGHVIMNSDGPSSSSSSASTIDLAVVYANFLKPKTPQERRLPLYHQSTYHDELISPPLDHITSISQANMDLALSPKLNHQEYLGEQGNELLLLHHHSHNKQLDQGHLLMQNPSASSYDHDHEFGALLPPLPGEAIPREKNNGHNVDNNALQSTLQKDPLEDEARFSSLFNIDGCWSPLDFSGYSDIQTPVAATTTSPTTTGAIRQQQWP